MHGLEQAKAYAACQRLQVPLAFASNGHLFVECDRISGLTSNPRPRPSRTACSCPSASRR
jgi:type I restriction enzyme R subunit